MEGLELRSIQISDHNPLPENDQQSNSSPKDTVSIFSLFAATACSSSIGGECGFEEEFPEMENLLHMRVLLMFW